MTGTPAALGLHFFAFEMTIQAVHHIQRFTATFYCSK